MLKRFFSLPLYTQIFSGIAAGVITGLMVSQLDGGREFSTNWIKPWGTIFINLLKLIAIPLILTSLIKGVSDLKDVSKLSSLGGKTLGFYLATTILAVTLGLVLVNAVKPGKYISEQTRTEMLASYGGDAEKRIEAANEAKQRGPLQPLIDIVPQNIFFAASSNSNMLQVICFALLFGIALILIPESNAAPVKSFFDSANDVVLKMVDMIMYVAPLGVFSLICSLIAETTSVQIFIALGSYALTVIVGLFILMLLIYPLLVKLLGGMNPITFMKGISSAQLVAFSTSSSAATLPITMDCAEKKLKVEKEVSSFVLPLGATLNMDGTSLYQAVAAVFISQVFGDEVTLQEQITIVLTATLASIGSAAVPGAGILMLVIVLESIGVSPAGIALIFAVDRPLDMLRTTVNVTSDAAVATIISRFVKRKRIEPKASNL